MQLFLIFQTVFVFVLVFEWFDCLNIIDELSGQSRHRDRYEFAEDCFFSQAGQTQVQNQVAA